MKVRLFIFTLLALLLVSCTREPLPGFRERGTNFFNRKQGKMVTISAKMPPDTRVTYNDGTRKLAWEGGDKLILAGYNGTSYKGSKIYNWIGGDNFEGELVSGATTYKAYYPGDVLTVGIGGNLQLPANFWDQTQNGSNTTAHLRNKLLLIDDIANPIDQAFNLELKSSIVRHQLNNVPKEVGTLDQLIWTVETTPGNFASMTLDVTGVTFSPTVNSMTAFIAFDPDVMGITAGGSVAITLVGQQVYRWSTISGGGKDYQAGNRYAGTVNGGWLLKNPLIYVAEYNVRPDGQDFVKNLTACDVSGYFTFAQANDKNTINIAGHHLPSIGEWSSIVPEDSKYVQFKSSKSYTNAQESVIVQGETINMTSDFQTTANNVSYALRYKGTDMVTAWRYELINYNTNTCHMKITSRNVAPSETIGNIATSTYWNSNNGNDVIRYFPASGRSNTGKNKMGLFWSATSGKRLLFDDKGSSTNKNLTTSSQVTVRLFVPGDNMAD